MIDNLWLLSLSGKNYRDNRNKADILVDLSMLGIINTMAGSSSLKGAQV
jgi:hypothetical protein